ncbi:MAG TPA: SDR family oxidoreductase [Bryobacteraceae bacterium]|nr:SDR family oxidoreductase [Bryobacteraceae bacterium]
MRIFVTGATGFIGSAIVPELINVGHQVLGLTHSDAGAKSLTAAGAQVHRGDLSDLESLRKGADLSDGVIHTAFIHDFSRFQEVCEVDRRAIEALGSALAGSGRPLLVTSGTAMANGAEGRPATELDTPESSHAIPRVASELAAAAFAAKGVRVGVMRLPQVHNTFKQGLVTYAIEIARQKGVSAYIGDGRNRWPAVHVLDAARVYRLALENLETGARYHAVAEEGVPMRNIAEVIGRGLKVPVISVSPEGAPAHFGWLAAFAGRDLPASGALTQERLAWRPAGPGLITDLEQMRYHETETDVASTAPARAHR